MKKVFLIGLLSVAGAFAMEEQEPSQDLQTEGGYLADSEAPDERLAHTERFATIEKRFNLFREKYNRLAIRARSTMHQLSDQRARLISALEFQESSKNVVQALGELQAEAARSRHQREISMMLSVAWLLVYAVKMYTC